jgi:hypothetical protein
MFDTPEEKAALKAAIDEATAAAKTEAAEAAAALAANNKKLLEQLREAKKHAEIDPAAHAALEDKVGELTTALSQREAAMKKAEKDSATQLAALTKQIESETGFTKTLLVENGLSDALVKAGVEPAFLGAVKAMLKGQVQIVADGESRKALVGDKPLTDFVTSWAASDEGKHFVKAPANGGGGAGGGSGGKSITTISADDKTAIGLNLAELAKGNNGAVQVV